MMMMMSTAVQAFTRARRMAALPPGQRSLTLQRLVDGWMTFG